MAIAMTCDHCKKLIDPNVSGGVRLKMGGKEYTFHLCSDCQELLRVEVKDTFLGGRPWKVT